MGILARVTREQRHPSTTRVAYSGRTIAGVTITPDTAVTVPAVWACLRYLSQTVAMLPWRVMREIPGGGEIAPSHPVDRLLYIRPSLEWSPFQFRETLTHWALRWGNGIAEIEPDALGRPYALWPIHPERVEVCRATEAATDAYGDAIGVGEIFYEVNNGDGSRTILSARRVFHIRGFGEGPVGVNVISYAAQSIGWAKAAQVFGASFFGNGMNVGGVVVNKKPLSPDGLKRQKAEMGALYGGPYRANKTAHLDNDADFKSIGIDPDKAQFIMTHQHLVEEVCRWFGVPPHKVAHLLRSTNNNIEHQSIEVVQDAILPWAKRFEEEADYKLFGARNRLGFYTKINLMGLLRGDFKSQAEGFRIYREMAVVNADEIRERIDLNPMPGGGGKKYTMQSQYTTLERIGEEPVEAAVMPPAPEPAEEDAATSAARVRADNILALEMAGG